ncbi:hypothetical protein ACP26F_05360 [Franconibacter pulveris 1160]|uniref:hypothetical protein n=1 Tax=Franconibacter TaxID=1649295 RepID=UPI000A7B1C02|nr:MULTISPECIES: hypothetical protein [Franconibacter]MEB5921529.1 hypothetical protein [Franconibacter daqui]
MQRTLHQHGAFLLSRNNLNPGHTFFLLIHSMNARSPGAKTPAFSFLARRLL